MSTFMDYMREQYEATHPSVAETVMARLTPTPTIQAAPFTAFTPAVATTITPIAAEPLQTSESTSSSVVSVILLLGMVAGVGVGGYYLYKHFAKKGRRS